MVDVFMFPGQGAQFVGMGKAMADRFTSSRLVFDEVDDVLGNKLSSLMWDGPASELALTENSQPATMAVSLATMKALQELGMHNNRAACVLGHSLGEYSALVAAGSLSVAEAARLLRIRGRVMQQAVPIGCGAMAALLGFDLASAYAVVEEVSDGRELCYVANDNSCDQVVISGTAAGVRKAVEIVSGMKGKRAVLLNVSAPFHCKLMQPAVDLMHEPLSSVHFKPPLIPVVLNVTARPLGEGDDIRERLKEQIVGVVRWRESIQYIRNNLLSDLSRGAVPFANVNCLDYTGKMRFFELGAGSVLTNLVRRMLPCSETFAINSSDRIEEVASSLS